MKKFWNPPSTGVQNFYMAPQGPIEKQKQKQKQKQTKKMKILIMYRIWPKCVPINLKQTP